MGWKDTKRFARSRIIAVGREINVVHLKGYEILEVIYPSRIPPLN